MLYNTIFYIFHELIVRERLEKTVYVLIYANTFSEAWDEKISLAREDRWRTGYERKLGIDCYINFYREL